MAAAPGSILAAVWVALPATPALGASPATIHTSFGPPNIALNGTTATRFQIGNPNPATYAFDINFGDTLPPGVVVATPNGWNGDDCGGGVLIADPGASSITFYNGALAPLTACAIEVNVTGTTKGDKTNSASVNSNLGSDGPSTAYLSVGAPNTSTKLVKDIYAGSDWSSGSQPGATIGGTTYFSATDGSHGYELWRSDGTSAGTKMVKDINPSGDSNPGDLVKIGGTLFFEATDGTHGVELWRSNGTSAGTRMVKDISSFGDSYPHWLTNVDGKLFFEADDGSDGDQLWRSDGTKAGTHMVKDISPSSVVRGPGILTNVGGILLFAADDGTHGLELWRSNGTKAGTTMVKNIAPGSSDSIPWDPVWIIPVVVHDTLFFAAADGTHGMELWRSDGTKTGTAMVKDINPSAGGTPFGFAHVGQTLFFEATDGTHGVELWRSNGTSAGTRMVKDINPGTYSDPSYLTSVGGTLWFSAYEPKFGYELYRSNGTKAGTLLVSNINPGGSSQPSYFTEPGKAVFFFADDGTHGMEPRKFTP
jgi:ELWxxDGT repeat protein